MGTSTEKRIRFMKGIKCPVCGGADDDRRGQGTRCHGYRSGDWVHCTREEFSGRAKFNANSQSYLHRAEGKCPCGAEHAPAPTPPPATKKGHSTLGKVAKVYKYRNAFGTVVFETVRFVPKDFRQRRPIGNGKFKWNLEGVELVLYDLPHLLTSAKGRTVYICEGEKDADNLGVEELVATTCPLGSEKWRESYSECLAGCKPARIAILQDNDDPRRRHVQAVAASLHAHGLLVHVIELPGLGDHGDVSDWLAAGGTAGQLEALVSRTAP